jgi:hypothetical protein
VIQGNYKVCGVHARLATELPFARGHIVFFAFGRGGCGVIGLAVRRRRGASVHYWCDRSAGWWWGKGKDFLLQDLYMGRNRTALTGCRTAWIVSRGGSVVGHWLSCGQINWGPSQLIKDLINKVLGTRISGGHADMEFVKGDDELVKVGKGGVG